MYFVVRTQGHVSGQEFAPSHFQVRNFSFYEIPLLHIQITPIRRKGVALPVATYVRQSSLIGAPKGTPDKWHLVSLSRGLSGTTAADADLMVTHLNLTDGTDVYWRKWSIDHPKRAAVLWPTVQRLAERELYILIPAVFELAQKDLTAEQLATKIDTLLRRQYRSLVVDMRQADRGELADQLLKEAISDYPDDKNLQALQTPAT
ncbi:MAG: hypothetical protein HKN47_29200 [Pirellulaceae bacterium]|nr:hypothetical protein [Pirellulaceae bacterium]